jgi:hypothetical protein
MKPLLIEQQDLESWAEKLNIVMGLLAMPLSTAERQTAKRLVSEVRNSIWNIIPKDNQTLPVGRNCPHCGSLLNDEPTHLSCAICTYRYLKPEIKARWDYRQEGI